MAQPEAPKIDPDKEILIAAFKRTLGNLNDASEALSPYSGFPKAPASGKSESFPVDTAEGKLPTGFELSGDRLTLVHVVCGARLPVPEGSQPYDVSKIAWAHTCGQSG